MNCEYISLFQNVYENPEKYHNIYVYQIAEAHLIPGGVIEEHIQFCDEISYIISGEAVFFNNDTPVKVKSGDIHIACKGEKHKISAEKNSNFRYVCFGIRINPESKDYTALENIFLSGKVAKVQAADEIRTLVSLLMNELYSKPVFNREMIEMLILQTLILIYRKHILGLDEKSRNTENFSGKAIYEIFRYIDKNLLTIKNIDMISESLSYSKYYISHIFKEKTGMTVMEYITRMKIDKATELLKNGILSISEIAEKLNYESAQSFSKMFKKNTGISPGNFQKELKTTTLDTTLDNKKP